MCDYSKLVAVTNRTLCAGDYWAQLGKVAALHPRCLILREKDLSPEEYARYAAKVLEICEKEGVPCFFHSHVDIARGLGCRRLHLSVPGLRAVRAGLEGFEEVSVSCHSIADVQEAAAAGATQVLLGNIFETDCKKGLPGKGLDFLREICAESPVPVYAIGGISPENLGEVLEAGAAGGCMMSGFMRL